MPNDEVKEQPKFVFFRLPYIGKTSNQIKFKINFGNFFEKLIVLNRLWLI